MSKTKFYSKKSVAKKHAESLVLLINNNPLFNDEISLPDLAKCYMDARILGYPIYRSRINSRQNGKSIYYLDKDKELAYEKSLIRYGESNNKFFTTNGISILNGNHSNYNSISSEHQYGYIGKLNKIEKFRFLKIKNKYPNIHLRVINPIYKDGKHTIVCTTDRKYDLTTGKTWKR